MGVSLLYGLALENVLGKKNIKNKEELLVSKLNSNGLLADGDGQVNTVGRLAFHSLWHILAERHSRIVGR